MRCIHIHLLSKPSASNIADPFWPLFVFRCTMPATRVIWWCVCVIARLLTTKSNMCVFSNNALVSRLLHTATHSVRTVELCFWYSIDVVVPLVWIYKIRKSKKGTYQKSAKKENSSKKYTGKITWKHHTHVNQQIIPSSREKEQLFKKKKIRT